MRSYIGLFSKLVCYALLICFMCAFSSHSDSVTFDNEYNGQLWYNKNAVVKNDKITSRDLWKSYQKRSSDKHRNNQYSSSVKGEPPYYLSYASGHQTKYQEMDNKIIEQKSRIIYDESSAPVFGLNEQEIAADIGNYNEEDLELPQGSDSPSVKSIHVTEAPKYRKVGKLGLNGYFGFFIHSKYFKCDKPKRLDPDPDSEDTYIIPDDIKYYKKCVYFEDNPIAKFQRKAGNLGKKAYFGYYEKGVYVECEPPKGLQVDSKTNDSYIPNEINYDPKCQYFEQNLTGIYDYLGGQRLDSGGVLNQINFFCFFLFICLQMIGV